MPDTARCCHIAGLVSNAASPVVLRLPGCFGEQGEPPAVRPTWGCACSSRRSATRGPRSKPVCYLPASCPGLTAIPPPARAACRGVADSSLPCSWLCPGTKALCEFLPPPPQRVSDCQVPRRGHSSCGERAGLQPRTNPFGRSSFSFGSFPMTLLLLSLPPFPPRDPGWPLCNPLTCSLK